MSETITCPLLHSEQVVAAAVDDGLGDLGLAPHGVDGHRRAAQVEQTEQFRNCGNLVRHAVGLALPDHQTRRRSSTR